MCVCVCVWKGWGGKFGGEGRACVWGVWWTVNRKADGCSSSPSPSPITLILLPGHSVSPVVEQLKTSQLEE